MVSERKMNDLVLDERFLRGSGYSTAEQPYDTVLVIGDIGAGKETFTKRFQTDFNHNGRRGFHFSSGEQMRLEKDKSDLGRRIGEIMDAQQLIPDELTMNFVKSTLARFEEEGIFGKNTHYLLADGVVRTEPQIKMFEKIARVYAVLNFVIPFEVANPRVYGRFLEDLKKHLDDPANNLPPRKSDEFEDGRKARYELIRNSSVPVVGYYENKGILRQIDATPGKEEVFQSAVRALDDLLPK